LSNCLIIAGEKSGEEHALSFFSELKRLSPQTHFWGVGGEELSSLGVELLYHLRDFSSMGFSEVVGKIPFYFKALNHLEAEVKKRRTKTAILIDFQDFNLRLAKKLSSLGVQVLYYVAPQAWAWKGHRAQALASSVHTLFTILPFEKDWFHSRGVKQVKAIPHPLMITYKNILNEIPQRKFKSWGNKIKILLLPGSRRFEISNLLPEFISAIKKLKEQHNIETHLVRVNHVDQKYYDYFQSEIDVSYESDELIEAMKDCHFCLAASGTVTLSTGIFQLPTLVCYKSSLLNEFIFNNFIQYSGPISLTNIVQGKVVFPEYIQDRVNANLLAKQLHSWIEDENQYNNLMTDLRKTRQLLTGEIFSIPEYISRVIND